MNFTIEIAKPGDEDRFFALWNAYSQELAEISGASVRADTFFRSLFDDYTSGRVNGVALIAFDGDRPIGISLWGVAGALLSSSAGVESAYGWDVYTVPEYRQQGVSTALRERSILELDAMGVKTAVGVVSLSNGPGIESSRNNGFVPTDLMGAMDLREQADRIRYGSADHKRFYWEGDCPLCGREAR